MGYNKTFIVLNKNDIGLCEQGATGYCKVESKDEQCSITVFIQGLKKMQNIIYRIYIMCNGDGDIAPVCLGNIDLDKSSGELYIESNVNNVLSSGIPVVKFNMVVVAAEDKNNTAFEFPLVGYHNIVKDDKWRNRILNHLSKNDKKVEAKENNKMEYHHHDEEKRRNNEKYDKNDNINNVLDYIKDIKKGNVKKLDGIMNSIREIEECNPFANVRLKYKWWKVKDFKFFDNIFKYSVVSTQIFKHPLIKKMLRESNHCLFGVVSDIDDKIRYVAYGFPARYSMKDQIYVGGFANFYPCAGYVKSSGAFGYWVVHIKLDDNSIIMAL